MSLETFLSKIWQGVMHLFNGMPVEIQAAASMGVRLVENIKSFDDKYPFVADIITALMPGDVDDKIKAWIRSVLPALLVDLRLASWQDGKATAEDVVNQALATIKQLPDSSYPAFAHDLAVLVAQEAAKAQAHTLSWSDAVYVIEWYYQNKFKAAA